MDKKLVYNLVGRINERLPHNSGVLMGNLGLDPILSLNCNVIVELAVYRHKDILHSLATILESMASPFLLLDDANLNVLHSQLFLLRLIGLCCKRVWNIPDMTESNVQLTFLTQPGGNNSSNPSTVPQSQFTDPLQLDEQLAKFLLGILIKYFCTTVSTVNPDTVNHNFAAYSTGQYIDFVGNIPSSSSYVPPYSLFTNIASFFSKGQSDHAHLFANYPVNMDLLSELQKEAGKIIFFLSASNWPIVFQKIRQRLFQITQQFNQSQQGQSEALGSERELGDLTELRLLEWCNLNRIRLSMVLAELSNVTKSFPKRAQLLSAIVIRRTVWNWIETFPCEFATLCKSQKRMDGNPEVLIEHFSNIGESFKRKNVYWPTQTSLLLLCPDILFSVGLNSQNSGGGVLVTNLRALEHAKKFLDTLRKSLKSKLVEVATLCYVDICRASTFVSKTDGVALRMIVPNIEAELKDKLFDPSRSLLPNDKSGDDLIIDSKVMTDCLAALYKLNSWNTLRNLIPAFLEWSSPVLFKVVLVRTCYAIVSEDKVLPWNPPMDASLAHPLRQMFLENITKDKYADQNPKPAQPKKLPFMQSGKNRKVNAEEANERNEVISNVLKTWCCCPLLAIVRDTTIISPEDIRILLVGISSCLCEPNPNHREKSAEAIFKFFSPDFIPKWDGSHSDWRSDAPSDDSEHSMKIYWRVSSQVLLSVSRQLLDIKGELLDPNTNMNDAKSLLNLVVDLLYLRNTYLRKRISEFKGRGGLTSVLGLATNTPDRFGSSVSLELSLLVFICSSDLEVSNLSVRALSCIIEEAELTGELRPDEAIPMEEHLPVREGLMNMLTENCAVYLEIRKLQDFKTGSKALQKRLRKLLRQITKPTPGNMGAWDEVYKRWKTLSIIHTSSAVTDSRDEDLDLSSRKGRKQASGQRSQTSIDFIEDKGDWHNYTGFLCALGGVCLSSSSISAAANSRKPSLVPPSGTLRRQSNVGGGEGEQVSGSDSNLVKGYQLMMSAYSEASVKVDNFLAEMVELSICDNVVVREAVKELLGNELNSGLYGILFKHIESVVSRFFDTEGETFSHEKNTLFVENSISILKLILERAEELSQDHLLNVDFGGLVLSFVQYLNQLAKVNQSQTSLRIKVKMCQLAEVLVGKKEIVGLRQEIRLRNRLVEVFLRWNSEFLVKSGVSDLDKNLKLHRDLDIACIKAMITLLDGLPLQIAESTSSGVKSATQNSTSLAADDDVDGDHEKGPLFHKYLSFFLKVLQKCKSQSPSGRGSDSPQGKTQNGDVTQTLSTLKEYTILALSNLLSANIEIGLKYSLSMGYHEDSKTRAAFMEVMTNILNQGSSEQFARLGEEGQVLHERYEKLLELLLEQDLKITVALCEAASVTDIDDIANMLLNVFGPKGKTLKLLKVVVENEVLRTESPANLFRRNSMATRLLGNYAKAIGSEYLSETLKPMMENLVDRNPMMSFEMDPTRLGPNESADVNLRNLKTVSQGFIDSIIGNVSKVPVSIREVCAHIAYVVGQRFPEARVTAVGGFIFLRFFCPSLVAPEMNGLVDKNTVINKELRRGLVLITKVIQNLANNVLFGIKENFMAGINDLLRENIGRVHGFLREVSTVPPEMLIQRSSTIEKKKIEHIDLLRLHRSLALNLDKVERILGLSVQGRGSSETSEENRSFLTQKKLFAQLSTLLAQLGSPPDISKIQRNNDEKSNIVPRHSVVVSSNQLYTDFMARMETRPGIMRYVENLRDSGSFFEAGLSKERRPVLYYIARRVSPDSFNMDLFLYHVLITLKAISKKPFELVVDCTQFAGANEWGIEALNQLAKVTPGIFTQNLQIVYFYNANTSFRRYTKRIMRVLESKIEKRMIFVSSVGELSEYLTDIHLPKSTMSLETDVTTISPVTKISTYRQQIPVSLKLSGDAIQITSLKSQDILGHSAFVNDVFHIGEIEDVGISSSHTGNHEFFIRYAEKVASYKMMGGSNSTISIITFSSPKREMILQAIRSSKDRFELARPQKIVADRRQLGPSDVPGTLLNMVMLNICSEDANLRVASYNLLCSLSSSFKFDLGNQLLISKGLCIPSNNQDFVVSTSKHLAATAKNLTLEFLLECCIGFMKSSKELKHYCLEYMAPWLPNIADFCRPGVEYSKNSIDPQHQKLKEVARLLIELTVKETEMYPSIQSRIWQNLGQVEEIVPFLLDAFLQIGIDHGVGSQHSEVAANSVITLASVNLHLISGKIIARLRKAISSTSHQPSSNLVDHPSMGEIAVLIRYILMLSFNNHLNVQLFLPELLHIVSLLIGVGPPIIRSSIHGIVVNIVQSLCTVPDLGEMNLNTLKVLLSNFSEPKMCLMFGLSGSGMVHHSYGSGESGWFSNTSSNAFLLTTDSLVGNSQREIPLTSVEMIVNCLLDVMNFGTADSELSATWKARWMSLITSTAFQYNPAIQPRAFIALGCLAQNEVDDDLLYQILVALRGALTLFEDNDCNLTVSIIMSLCNIVGGLNSDSRYLKSLFWLSFALTQIGHVPIFNAALSLLQVVLHRMEDERMFENQSVTYALTQSRSSLLEVMGQLDSSVGIHFRSDFAFAISVNLMKGLKHHTTRQSTSAALSLLLELSAKYPPSFVSEQPSKVGLDRLGYIIPLLPSAERKSKLYWLAGIDEKDPDFVNDAIQSDSGSRFKQIIEQIMPDVDISTLTVSMIVSMLEFTEHESEMLYIYTFLSEAAHLIPEVFAMLYDTLLPRMSQILITSQSPQIVQVVQSILQRMVSINPAVQSPPRKASLRKGHQATPSSSSGTGVGSSVNHSSVLNDLGFAGILEAGSFQNVTKQRKAKNASLACSVVDVIIK